MILQALYHYYQNRQKSGELPPPGFEFKPIPYRILIDKEGRFVDWCHIEDAIEVVPKDNARTSAIAPQLLWDYLDYVLGVPTSEEAKSQKRVLERFESFKDRILTLPDLPSLSPLKTFYKEKHYQEALNCKERIADIQKKKAYISFEIIGAGGHLITNARDVIDYVRATLEEEKEKEKKMVCLVTGKSQQPIAMTHSKVKIGANNSPLISFQVNQGFDSYAKTKGENAPISMLAADAIHSALQDLLGKEKNTHYSIGNTTYLFWSSVPDERLIELYHTATFTGRGHEVEEKEEEEETTTIEETATKPTKRSRRKDSVAKATEEDKSKELLSALKALIGEKGKHISKTEERFYVLGIMPQLGRHATNGRHAIKLWVEGSVHEIVGNTLQHLEDMNIVNRKGIGEEGNPPLRSLYHIVQQLKPKSKPFDKFSETILNSIVDSIVRGIPYPQQLQTYCLERICREHRRSYRVTPTKAAILKAYINRKNRFYNSTNSSIVPLTMALDPQQTDIAYITGRLFSLLEGIQYAAQGNLNSNICDRYFTFASTQPALIIGRLVSYSKHHLAKIRRQKEGQGKAIYFEKEIQKLIQIINGNFPPRFTPDQQSIFVVGYYHQRVHLFSKKSEETTEELTENNE